MQENQRRMLLGTRIIDIEESEGYVCLYVENEAGDWYGINVNGEIDFVKYGIREISIDEKEV